MYYGLVMKLNDFLTSGFNFTSDEYELKLHFYLFNSILLTVVIMLSILTFVRVSENN